VAQLGWTLLLSHPWCLHFLGGPSTDLEKRGGGEVVVGGGGGGVGEGEVTEEEVTWPVEDTERSGGRDIPGLPDPEDATGSLRMSPHLERSKCESS
jgi:hypothetical protein